MSLGHRRIYKQLLQQHGRIRIPKIQRDYAQGRGSEKTVRDQFLDALKEALDKPAGDPALPLNLDFIYGSVEGDGKRRFLPLDGQQRLTTLFLLHWYLAWRDKEQAIFQELFLDGSHARFAYDVRPSSNEFFDKLVRYHPSRAPEEVPDLAALITDQPWYFRSWRLDPTIQAVLCMLDAIHQKFAAASGLFARLLDEGQPAITFQLLELENFGLSDDLYIKMNARGKPLTAFETFKARYEQELIGQLAGVTFDLDGEHFPAAEYVSRRMDTAWTDLFWRHRDPRSQSFDEALMNVFRTVALITRDVDGDAFVNDNKTLRDLNSTPSYAAFHERGWLDESFTGAMIRLLDAWSAKNGELACLLPNRRYFDEEAIFTRVCANGPKASSSAATLSYAELVQFAAYVYHISAQHDCIDPAAFQEWMRVVFNLSTNTIYNRVEDFGRSIRAVAGLVENAGDILNYFAEAERPATGFYEPQIAEEKLKAELILADAGWRPLFDRAEGHDYFRGQIWFLLDFCGAAATRNDGEPNAWDPVIHADLQEHFSRYLALAVKMFSADGLVDLGEHRWQRALLCVGNYLLPNGRNFSFLEDRITDEASWKRLLRGVNRTPEPREHLKQLWDRLAPAVALAPQLDAVIAARPPLEPWRELLVRYPQAVAYCAKRNIRWENSHTLYLLKKSQLNGAHAELFTFCLHEELLRPENGFAVLKPYYHDVTDTTLEPYVALSFTAQGKQLAFFVENRAGGYQIDISKSDCKDVEHLVDTLRCLGFSGLTEAGDWLWKRCGRDGAIAQLKEIDEALNTQLNHRTDHA